MKYLLTVLTGILFCVVLVCCNKSYDLATARISDYTNLGVGKYVIYRLDSTVTLPFGTGFTVHSYTVKDSIEGTITDNLERPGYRIVRYTYDSSSKTWNNSNTFMAVQTNNSFEYVENNMRQVRLVSPIADYFSWKGNSHVSVSPYANLSTIDLGYFDWTFSYSNVNKPFKVGNTTFDTTVTVVQYDSANNKPFQPNFVSSYIRSYEVYAKGVGKVFQDLFAWEYQITYFTRNCKLIHCLNNKCDTTAIKCTSDAVVDFTSKNCDSIARASLDAGTRVVCDTIPGNYTYSGYGVKLSILNHN